MSVNCWICEKWKYTCIITSIYLVIREFIRADEFDSAKYERKINNADDEDVTHINLS